MGWFASIDQEQVAEGIRLRLAPGLGRVIARVADGRLDELEVADAVERQALEASILAHEPSHELGGRIRQDVGRRAELRQDAAVLEDGHQVAHLDGLIDVVGHEQDGLGELLLEAQELVLEPLADDGIDGAERLVHEHDRAGRRPGPAPRRRADARRPRAGSG